MHYFSASASPEDRRDCSYLADWETLLSKRSAQLQGGTLRVTPGAGGSGHRRGPTATVRKQVPNQTLGSLPPFCELSTQHAEGDGDELATLVTTQYMAGTGRSISTTGLVLIGTSLGEAERTWIWIKSTPPGPWSQPSVTVRHHLSVP